MSVKARKLKDGSTVYDVTNDLGRSKDGKRLREYKTFDKRKDAEKYDKEQKQTAQALKSKSGKLTLGEYIDRCYWPITSRRLQATSLDTYEREIRKRIKPHLGDMRLDKIDRYSIQGMLDDIATQSVSKKCLSTLKTILNEAVYDGYIPSNPACAKYAHPKQKGKRDNGVILSDFTQISDYTIQVINDAPEAITRLVLTGLLLGLRPEERYALDFEDIDFVNRVVHVSKAYVTVSGKRGGHVLKIPKTELSNRTVPMPQVFTEYLYYERDGTGAYITNRYGKRLSPSTGQKMWRRYLDAHPDLPRVTLENMRHSYATSCIHAGMPVADLSRILGHSDINTTYRRYVKPQFSDMQKSMVSIDAIIN